MDVLNVTVTKAELKVSEASDRPYVGLTLQLRDPYFFMGEEVGYVYGAVSNSPDWAPSYGRARLRFSLGLEPVILAEVIFFGVRFLTVPLITKEEVVEIVGRDLRVEVDVQEYPFGGEGVKRLHISRYLPKGD